MYPDLTLSKKYPYVLREEFRCMLPDASGDLQARYFFSECKSNVWALILAISTRQSSRPSGCETEFPVFVQPGEENAISKPQTVLFDRVYPSPPWRVQ